MSIKHMAVKCGAVTSQIRHALKVSSHSVNSMVYGETDRFSLEKTIKVRMICSC